MLQIGDADSEEVTVYADQPGFPPLSEGVDRLKSAERVVFHGGMKFDIHVINRFFPGALDPLKLFDSLVAARLLFPTERNHNLEVWGERLGIAKGTYGGDFSRFDQEMVDYGIQDIHVGRALYRHEMAAMEGWNWEPALQVEFPFAYIMALQEQNGFMLDMDLATKLEAELKQEKSDIEVELQKVFPPIITERYSEKTGKRLKDGVEIFNPGSRQQVGRRLIDKYGWKPRKHTPTGIPTIDEDVLNALPYPEAKPMLRYLRVTKQLGQLADGDNGWLKVVDTETSRVHGAINTLGTLTGRCSHFKPNMGQVDKKDARMRQVWRARHGMKLVGVDADGLEFRLLAHYIAPHDPEGKIIRAVTEGDKDKGTDIHSLNKTATGLYIRDKAKRCFYAMIYGGRDKKLGEIAHEDARDAGKPLPKGNLSDIGKVLREAMGRGTPGLDKIIADVTKVAAKRKWLKSLTGRKIQIRSFHSSFNFLLQGGGADVMKVAVVIFHFERCPAKGWEHGRDFFYVAHVHDEYQIEARPEIAEELGAEFANCIREAGERLGVRCPLAGSYDIGDNWAATH